MHHGLRSGSPPASQKIQAWHLRNGGVWPVQSHWEAVESTWPTGETGWNWSWNLVPLLLLPPVTNPRERFHQGVTNSSSESVGKEGIWGEPNDAHDVFSYSCVLSLPSSQEEWILLQLTGAGRMGTAVSGQSWCSASGGKILMLPRGPGEGRA